MLNRSKLWATTLLVGVFAVGIVLGGPAWSALRDNERNDRSRRGGSSESRGREHRSYSDHLQDELNLTVEQRAAVDSILALSQSDMRTAWRDLRARIDTLRQNVAEEIMLRLDEEQQTVYREMLERSRRRGDRERESRENRDYD
jgi:hypothetical protein